MIYFLNEKKYILAATVSTQINESGGNERQFLNLDGIASLLARTGDFLRYSSISAMYLVFFGTFLVFSLSVFTAKVEHSLESKRIYNLKK